MPAVKVETAVPASMAGQLRDLARASHHSEQHELRLALAAWLAKEKA